MLKVAGKDPGHSQLLRLTPDATGNPDFMIGQLRSVVVDCKDPRSLATFYSELLGGTVDAEDDTWVVLTDPGGRRLAFQYSPEHEPPRFPDPAGSQQFHLDVLVDDADDAERKVLALGATRVDRAVGEDLFRVFRDPAGHTFCLVWGVDQ
jgi:catechol-2,3-dioxygenase